MRGCTCSMNPSGQALLGTPKHLLSRGIMANCTKSMTEIFQKTQSKIPVTIPCCSMMFQICRQPVLQKLNYQYSFFAHVLISFMSLFKHCQCDQEATANHHKTPIKPSEKVSNIYRWFIVLPMHLRIGTQLLASSTKVSPKQDFTAQCPWRCSYHTVTQWT